MARAILVIFATLGLCLTASAQKHCYMPDGTIDDKGTVPCNSTAAVSACCDPRDSCSISGLCLGASGWIYRSACTDSTWTSPACAQQCLIGKSPFLSPHPHQHLHIHFQAQFNLIQFPVLIPSLTATRSPPKDQILLLCAHLPLRLRLRHRPLLLRLLQRQRLLRQQLHPRQHRPSFQTRHRRSPSPASAAASRQCFLHIYRHGSNCHSDDHRHRRRVLQPRHRSRRRRRRPAGCPRAGDFGLVGV